MNASDGKIVDALKATMFRHMILLITDDIDGAEIVIDAEWKQRIRQEIDQVIEFEIRLANITIPADRKREDSGSSVRRTLGELNIELNFMNWTSYFQNAFQRINHSISNETEVRSFGYILQKILNHM